MAKFYKPDKPTANSSKIIPKPQEKPPTLGMTFAKMGGSHGLHEYCELCKKNAGKKAAFDEFDTFRKDMQKCSSMTEFLQQFSSHNGDIKSNDHIDAEAKRLVKDFGYEDARDNIRHIHLKRGGKGQTIAWGIVFDNVFELLSIDPEHKTIK